MPRLISLSRTGRHVAVRSGDGIELVDALGTAPRVRLPGTAADFACAGTQVWVLAGDGTQIDRYALASGRAVQPAIGLAAPARALVADRGVQPAAIVTGDAAPVLALEATVHALPAIAQAFPLGAHRIAAIAGSTLQLVELGRRDPIVATIKLAGELAAVAPLYGGRMIAVLAHVGTDDVWTVLRNDGSHIHQITTPRATSWSVAGDAGVAMVVIDDATRWLWLDLRYGTVRGDGLAPFAVDQAEVSCDGRHVVFAHAGDAEVPRVLHVPAVELLARATRTPTDAAPVELPVVEPPAPELPAPVRAAVPPRDPELDTLVPRALGAPLPPLASEPSAEWPAYGSAREHLDDMLDLVAARAARAIADGWDSGRLAIAGSHDGQSREVLALLGGGAKLAPHELDEADARLALLSARNSGRVRSTIAAGIRLPFVELMRELDLSPIAGHILMIAIAAVERGELARLFRILAGDAQRPCVDRSLVETILAGGDRVRRAAISAELADNAPLRRHGVLHAAGDSALDAITVDPIVIARCCERLGAAASVRPLAELAIAATAMRALCTAVAEPRTAGDPLRLVLRGRKGSGRRSAIAALAARVGRSVGDIDCARFPRAGGAMATALQHELRRAVLRGCVPVVSGLELADPSDGEGQDRIRQVVRAHPGPIVIRTMLESHLPIDPGFHTVTLTPLTETERAAFWRTALARAGFAHPDVDGLAARWRIAPGQIEDVIEQADGPDALDDIARQHIATRLAHVATPVRRLAEWESVALADDVVDSIREFIGRVAQRKTVFDDWGFDAKVTSSRGLTALFYGPPGTGKSMVAGLIARELGLELYRVDLSRVVSKWIGETEKNLGEVFDAAEDGQVVILFDEADSLFAKRTEVKTSVDRYANLEVNYLLQRLDSFEGVAILTTNLDGSIDPAFKRRMSMRLQFPFPDEDMRKRLWAAHIPNETPVANDFNFEELARRFPLSGGYIRNSALRAAFLAAQERRPLAHEHLLRAITLEYRELGKLATDGRLE
ncbi:MAG: ATP-binding protein [Kofleriaceae bacterium]